MIESLKRLLSSNDYRVRECFTLPARDPSYSPVPNFLELSGVAQCLKDSLKAAGGKLWKHQSKALEIYGRGRNVVVATGTASGKSAIFRAAAFHLFGLSS